MGFFAAMDREKYDRQYTDRQLLRRMMDYFRLYSIKIIGIVILLIITALTGAFSPVIISRGVGMLTSTITNKMIFLLSAAVLGIGILSWFSNWARRKLMVRVVGDTVLTLRTDAFQAAMNHDLSFYDEYSTGKIALPIQSF
jgi:ATP-binding cassette subfamily B protein